MPRLLPEHSSATSTGASTTRPGSAIVGTSRSSGVQHAGGADLLGEQPALLARLDAHDVVDAEGTQRGDGEGADRPGARHEHAVARAARRTG